MSTAPAARDDVDESDEVEEGSEESLGTLAELETAGPCKLKIRAEVPGEKVTELLDKNYRDLISSLQIPGFRRGRVPRALVEKRYGAEIEKDLQEALLGDSFAEVVEEHELRVVGSPKFDNIEFKKEEPFRYEAEVETRPEFELGSYKGIQVERVTVPVTDTDVEESLDALRARHATLEPVDLAAAGPADLWYGSCRFLDGGEDGAELLRDDEVLVVPENGAVAGIEVPDLGKSFEERNGKDTLHFTVTVPEDDEREAIRGKQVMIELKLEDAKTRRLPELDDEFAKGLQFESVDELRKFVVEDLEARSAREEERRLEEAILEKIEAALDFALPEGLVEQQKALHKLQNHYRLLQLGKTKEEIDEELKNLEEPAEDVIRREMKRHFILESIAEKEKIFATEDDIRERIHLFSHVYGKSPRDVARELEESGRIEELRVEIRHGKVRKLLREKGKVVEPGAGSAPAEESDKESAMSTESSSASGGEPPAGPSEAE